MLSREEIKELQKLKSVDKNALLDEVIDKLSSHVEALHDAVEYLECIAEGSVIERPESCIGRTAKRSRDTAREGLEKIKEKVGDA